MKIFVKRVIKRLTKFTIKTKQNERLEEHSDLKISDPELTVSLFVKKCHDNAKNPLCADEVNVKYTQLKILKFSENELNVETLELTEMVDYDSVIGHILISPEFNSSLLTTRKENALYTVSLPDSISNPNLVYNYTKIPLHTDELNDKYKQLKILKFSEKELHVKTLELTEMVDFNSVIGHIITPLEFKSTLPATLIAKALFIESLPESISNLNLVYKKNFGLAQLNHISLLLSQSTDAQQIHDQNIRHESKDNTDIRYHVVRSMDFLQAVAASEMSNASLEYLLIHSSDSMMPSCLPIYAGSSLHIKNLHSKADNVLNRTLMTVAYLIDVYHTANGNLINYTEGEYN